MIRFHVKFGIIGLEQIYSKLTELHGRTCSEKKKKAGVFISIIPFRREKLLSVITKQPWKQCKETYQDPNKREIK